MRGMEKVDIDIDELREKTKAYGMKTRQREVKKQYKQIMRDIKARSREGKWFIYVMLLYGENREKLEELGFNVEKTSSYCDYETKISWREEE